jgi:hypothetical protein
MNRSLVRSSSRREQLSLAPSELWYGRSTPVPPVRALRVGSLAFELDGVDLSRVRWGSTELVDRIYMSVRDRNWDTVLPVVSDLSVARRHGGLEVTFTASNRAGDIDFGWHGSITATSDGKIDYAMEGVAHSDFEFCRIGFCILHSEASAAGRPYRAETPDGAVSGVLPWLIAPQEIVDGRELALIPPCSSLEVDLDGVTVRTAFEGSLFSAEDQRNWTDASFKTCCVAGPDYPYPAARGRTFAQRVRLTTTKAAPARPVRSARNRSLEVGAPSGGTWPGIGLGIPGGSAGIGRREASRLAGLGLDHLRVDLHLAAPAWARTLAAAAATAAAVGARLEIALFVDDAGRDRLAQLGVALTGLPIARLIVLPEWTPTGRTTPPGLVEVVRTALHPATAGVALIGGTDGDFAELNRDRPPMDGWDGVSYSVNPQVHAFDDRSLMETIPTQATTVETARSFAGTTPILVGPVTLRQRFNPSAIGEATIAQGELPSSVDVRQMSLFGAGWTLGSIASLAGAGAVSLTYFETVGWRGVMDAASGNPSDAAFPSRPGMVYPMYHVFADLVDRAALQPLSLRPTIDGVTGVAMSDGDRLRVLVANLTASRVPLALGPFGGRSARMRLLDDASAATALLEPGRFRLSSAEVAVRAGQVHCTLGPFAYAWLEGTAAPSVHSR